MKNELFWRGHHCYERCPTCGKMIRVNKPVFGSLHVCLSDEEIRCINERRYFETTNERRLIKRSVITYQDNEKACGFIEFEES